MSTAPDQGHTGRRILSVDDQPGFLDGLSRQLRGKFALTTAVGARAGLDTLRDQGPFAVVMADFNMAEMNGIEFLREVQQRSPKTVTVLLTGRAELDEAISALHEGRIFRFLNRPCPPELLENTLNGGLEQHWLLMAEKTLAAELNRTNRALRELNAGLEAKVAKRTASILALYEFVSALNGLSTVEQVAERVVATAAELFLSRRVSLMMPDPAGQHLTIAAAVGIPEDISKQVRLPIGASIAGRVFSESLAVIVRDPRVLAAEPYGPDSFANLPAMSSALSTADGPVGVLNVTEQFDREPYSEEDLAVLQTVTDAAATAILNQMRLRERDEARDATILALAKLAEHRDPDTGAHLERVQTYCRLLSEALARTPAYASVIDEAFIEAIARSSPLHDIGKVGVPDRILLKPGRLTEEEFEVMRRHAVIGGDTIRALIRQGRAQGFLKMAMEIAYAHHEKFDGSGYPRGLADRDIPLPARIMAVADVYDALTSTRVYKHAVPHPEAAALIRADSGAHFDPDVVEAFGRCEAEFARQAVELADASEAAAGRAQAASERQSLDLAADLPAAAAP